MALIQGIHHVALKCSDVEEFEKAVEFYTKVLGLRVKRRWGEGSDSGIMIDTGAGVVEIFAKNDGPLPQGTIRHFALKVKDADACAELVRAAGYPITDGPRDVVIKSDPPFPARVCFCLGAVGEEIEFFEEKPMLRDPEDTRPTELTQTWTVTEDMTAAHLRGKGTAIFSTPSMVSLMERTCLELAKAYLAEGQSTVGAEVRVRHLAPTPVGGHVTCRAVIRTIEGRRMWFDAEMTDDKGKVGEGSHLRVIVAPKAMADKAEKK